MVSFVEASPWAARSDRAYLNIAENHSSHCYVIRRNQTSELRDKRKAPTTSVIGT